MKAIFTVFPLAALSATSIAKLADEATLSAQEVQGYLEK